MKTLFILNGAPYGDERTYNGMRLAGALTRKTEAVEDWQVARDAK